jgi:membrane-associated protein
VGLDPQGILNFFGAFAVIGLFLIIFAESGLLVGFFFPGDSLLFVAGLLAHPGKKQLAPLWVILLGCFVAAVLGDQVGYVFGKKVGPSLFKRPDSRIFKQAYVGQAQDFFEKHGPKTILLARFVPIVRTFAPIVAGVANMRYRTFLVFNVVGGLLWAVGITMLGYIISDNVPWVKDNIEIVAIGVVVLSLIPAGIEIYRARRHRRRETASAVATADAGAQPTSDAPAAPTD